MAKNLKLSRYLKAKRAESLLTLISKATQTDMIIFDREGDQFLACPKDQKMSDSISVKALEYLKTIESSGNFESLTDQFGTWVTIIARKQVIGLALIYNFKDDDPEVRDAQANLVRENISGMIEYEYVLKDMSSQLIGNYEELNLLYDVSRKTSSIHNIQEVKRTVVVDTVEIISAQNGFLFLEDESTGEYVLEYVYDPEILDHFPVKSNELILNTQKDIVGEIFSDRKAKVINDQKTKIYFKNSKKTISMNTVICAPLETVHKILGVLILINKDDDEIFTAGDCKLAASMANQAGQAVENAQLFLNLEYEKNIVERIIETTADGIIVSSASGQITRFNQEARDIFNVKGEVPTADEIENNSRLNLLMRRLKAFVGKSGSFEMIVMKPQKLFLAVYTNPLQDHNQQIVGMVASVRNLTDIKRTEREKREIVSLLAQKLPALSEQIVQLVLHHPRKASDSDNDGIIRADQLGEVAVDLDRRITRLRRFLQIIAGPLRIERMEVDLVELVKTMSERYDVLPISAILKIKVNYKNEIGIIKVDTDHFKELLEILFENVFDHAVKQNDHEKALLEIEFERDGEFLIGTFKDNGKGISEYLLPLLFEPTVQLEEHEELRLDEIGMGLPYANHIVHGHGGEISVASDTLVGNGCTIKFRMFVGMSALF